MKRFSLFLSLILLLVVAAGCGCHKHLPVSGQVENHADSVTTAIRDSTVIRYVYMDVPVPAGSAAAVMPASDTSHLETDVAESDAYIDQHGLLHHTLNNKPGRLPMLVPVKEYYHDLASSSARTSSITKTVTVEVEKDLSFTQKALIRLGVAFLVIAFVGIIVFLARNKLLHL